MGHMSDIKIGFLTSGGDAQGMNAVVRAIIRTAHSAGATAYAIHEGWKGAIAGGDYIRPTTWNDASGILPRGGTAIGTARSDEFRTREGRKRAVANFVERGIDRLVIVGGDGTLTGADMLRAEWPSLLEELAEAGEITREQATAHSKLHIAGVVGSIDNDLVGTDMTVGADSALTRIMEALDAIASTAASHQRTFIIEVMGRHCGYLALMSAIVGGSDYVFIPENPPEPGWELAMCDKLRQGRASGRRDSIIILAEGAIDRSGQPITSTQIAQAVKDGLGEDARITNLGHVQRGGTPSAYDRWMSTVLGYTATLDMVNATDDDEPTIIGTQRNRIIRLPMMDAIASTRKVKDYMASGEWEKAIESRGRGYGQMIALFETLSAPSAPKVDGERKRVGILHSGGLAPGMNPAARAAVKLGLSRGWEMVGIEGGFPGLLAGSFRSLEWADVEGWATEPGAELGTRRTIPESDEYYALGRAIENAKLDALVMIGGFKGYKAIYNMVTERTHYPAFNIPMICVPSSIDNNLPGSELSIGADTALNVNAKTIDAIKASASASQRAFVVETMGRQCGYLALMSAITTGAEQVYLAEQGITLARLADDAARMVRSFSEGRHLYLSIRNESASEYYTTDFLRRTFEEEGGGLFDVRSHIIGHTQQGGRPSPFDRTLAVRLVDRALAVLDEQLQQGKTGAFHVGHLDGQMTALPITHMPELIDMDSRLPYEQWWMGLTCIAAAMADAHYDQPLTNLSVVLHDA